MLKVMELVFTMLKGLDEMAPFLKEEITQYESTRSKTSSSVWQFYSKTAGSVEILRGGKVEKYVFRYDPKWQPSVFQKVVRIEDVMSSILSITRLDNPQRRLEELVHTTINMHFEVGRSCFVPFAMQNGWIALNHTFVRHRESLAHGSNACDLMVGTSGSAPSIG